MILKPKVYKREGRWYVTYLRTDTFFSWRGAIWHALRLAEFSREN